MKIKKVTIEYEDSEPIWLYGDDAARWEKAVDQHEKIAWKHGCKIEPFDWNIIGD